MPAMNFSELRTVLEEQIRAAQLPEALRLLLENSPKNGDLYRLVSAFIARYNAAKKDQGRNTISPDEFRRREDQISADLFDLLANLSEPDFAADTPARPASGKTGSVLYRVPDLMHLQKPTRCTIRVAVTEDALLTGMVFDEHVAIKNEVEISDVMSAELLDPEGDVFKVSALNARTQLMRDAGFTEWIFQVTPLRTGVHQLLVKVSIMEVVPGFAEPIPREVSLMETVTILTDSEVKRAEPAAESPAARSSPSSVSEGFKSGGLQIRFQGLVEPKIALPPKSVTDQPVPPRPSPVPPPSSPASPAPSSPPQKDFEAVFVGKYPYSAPPAQLPPPQMGAGRSRNRGLQAMAVILALIVAIPAATWALVPDLPAWVNAHYIEGTPEAYAAFIAEHEESPRLEKAYYYRAETSGELADLRAYEGRFREKGAFRADVSQKIAAIEKSRVRDIQVLPNRAKIQQFAADFPETERLSDLKNAVAAAATNQPDLWSDVEDVYISSLKKAPTEAKVNAYIKDFPQQKRLDEVVAAAETRPEVFAQVQPALEEAYLTKMEQEPSPQKADAFLEKFPDPIKRDKLEKIIEKRPAMQKVVRAHEASGRVRNKQ